MLKSQRLESNKSGIGFNTSQTSSSRTKFIKKPQNLDDQEK